MDVRWITPQGIEHKPVEALPELLARNDGFVWLNIHRCDEAAVRVLTDVFHFHPLGVRECQARVPLPKVHIYPDHFFAVFYSVDLERDGRLRLFQICSFTHERKYFVTVHDPQMSETADLMERETQQVLSRIEDGRFRPRSPGELSHAVVSALAQRIGTCVQQIASQVERLERSVTRGRLREYERMLEGLFDVRHNLQSVRTITSTTREIHARMMTFGRSLSSESNLWLQDQLDQFERLKSVCDGEKELLQEILDLYQTRVANDLSQLVRRLTAMGAILVADTLIAGIYGMNFDHMPELHWEYGYPFAMLVMAVVSLGMIWYFRGKDWL